MNVEQIIKRVRDIAGDTDVLQFTDATLIEWINDGMRECAINNDLFQKSITQAAAVGTSEYTLPADIAKLHSVRYDNAKLTVLTLEEFDEQFDSSGTETGTPQNVVIWAGKLRLWPAPDSVKNIKVDYIAQTTEVAENNDTPALPVAYHRRLVDYCLAMVAQQDDDLNRYQLKMQEFETGVQKLTGDHEMEQDVYPYISVDSRDMGSGAFWGDYD
jgi:hypothetical protein